MTQLAFQWPERTSYAPEDFIASQSNAQAVETLTRWTQDGAALLSGEKASGKTHLALCWAARTGGIFIDRESVGTTDSATLWHGAQRAVLEDIDRIEDQEALFHLLRHTEASGHALLLTSRLNASQLPFTLPDLLSRLKAMPQATLKPPDDELLRLFAFKYFADRQLKVSEDAIAYLIKHSERTLAALGAAAESAARIAAEGRRDITVPLVKTVLIQDARGEGV